MKFGFFLKEPFLVADWGLSLAKERRKISLVNGLVVKGELL